MTRRKSSNVTGLERTLKAVAGRLTEEHEALVALARGLAAAVDAEPGNAALWRELRAALAALTEAAAGDDVDDDTTAFFVKIQTPGLRVGTLRGPVGDPAER